MDFEDIIPMFGIFIICFLLIPILVLSLPEVVSEEQIEVIATITETHHSPGMGGPYVYKVADYDIYFEYNGIKGSWDTDSKTYNQYKDQVGKPIKCYLITRIYDNGNAELELVAVDDYIGRR